MTSAPTPFGPPEGLTVEVVPGATAAESVQADERLLRTGRPAVRVAVLADRTLSIGVAVSDRSPLLRRASAEGLPVVRRGTGGTSVVHRPGDIAWSILLPRSDPRTGRDFVRAYGRLGGGPVEWIRSLGLESHWGPPPGLLEEYCLLSARGEVLWSKEKVVGGAAQHATSTTLLHHGILPRSVDRNLLDRLFGPVERGVWDRLGSLEELGIRTPPDRTATELARAIVRSLTPPRAPA